MVGNQNDYNYYYSIDFDCFCGNLIVLVIDDSNCVVELGLTMADLLAQPMVDARVHMKGAGFYNKKKDFTLNWPRITIIVIFKDFIDTFEFLEFIELIKCIFQKRRDTHFTAEDDRRRDELLAGLYESKLSAKGYSKRSSGLEGEHQSLLHPQQTSVLRTEVPGILSVARTEA